MGSVCYCCGYSKCIEKHHPDGKETFIEFSKVIDGQRIITLAIVYNTPDEYIDSMVKDGFKYSCFKAHLFPEIFVHLCPNCHVLIHRYGKTILELRNGYLAKREFLDHIIKQINDSLIVLKSKKRGTTIKEIGCLVTLEENMMALEALTDTPKTRNGEE